ncbi:hypothetical protein CHARACLAT_007082 [Characodon lateralis]|uniref:Uncharacterized protein n=1 Tax=Characodon lateralis TaxID=208331 RepID=A0ABU7F0U2_9TELE|nr:hypothetical protein [Characodon lateralis]
MESVHPSDVRVSLSELSDRTKDYLHFPDCCSRLRTLHSSCMLSLLWRTNSDALTSIPSIRAHLAIAATPEKPIQTAAPHRHGMLAKGDGVLSEIPSINSQRLVVAVTVRCRRVTNRGGRNGGPLKGSGAMERMESEEVGGGHRVGGHKQQRQVGGGGTSLVQCNGKGSCEKKSPLFPTPGPM